MVSQIRKTINGLVIRFYDLQIDALGNVDLAFKLSYRYLLGIVEQDVFLFDGTIAEHLQRPLGGAITESAPAASTANSIERLSDGYDTVIGRRRIPE